MIEIIILLTDLDTDSIIRISLIAVGAFAAIVSALASAFVVRKRRNRAIQLQSRGNNRNSSGRTRLLDGDNTNNDPMDFSNSQPSSSKIIIHASNPFRSICLAIFYYSINPDDTEL